MNHIQTVCGQSLLMQPLPTVRKVYSLILQEEKQRESIITKEAMVAGVVGNHTFTNKTSRINLPFGNTSMGNSSTKNRKKLHCTNCNRDNHTVDKRFYINGFPHGYKAHRKKEFNGEMG